MKISLKKIVDVLKQKEVSIRSQIQHGREVSEQMRAEKLRKKNTRITDGKPSAVNTIGKHLIMRTKNPLDVMKDEYSRRKYERKNK